MALSLADILSNFLKDELILYIESNPKKIPALIQLAISNKPPDSARAAWLLSKVISKMNIDITSHVSQILTVLPVVEDGHKRDLISILTATNIPENEEGILFDICVSFWSDVNKIPSVRYKAFTFMLKMCTKYPELKTELILLTEDYYIESLSQGIKKTILKRIHNFKQKYNIQQAM